MHGASKAKGSATSSSATSAKSTIIHVLRCFEDDDIQHVENKVDPVADAETVETELLLSRSREHEARPRFREKGGAGRQGSQVQHRCSARHDLLRDGKPARLTDPKDADEERILRRGRIANAQPVLYVAMSKKRTPHRQCAQRSRLRARQGRRAQAVIVSAAISANSAWTTKNA